MNSFFWTIRGRRWATGCGLLAAAFLLFGQPAHAESVRYSYDQLQRLKQVTYGDGTKLEYVYDNVGNRLMKTTTLPASPPNNPPNPLSNPGIAYGATGVSTTPVLSWPAGTDPNSGDAVAHYLYLGTTPTPPLVFSGWQTNWAPGQLQCFTTYFWSVVTRDSHNAQTSSPLWTFTTGDTPPTPDFAATPASGPAPLTVRFQDQSDYHCGAGAAWQWDFNNDGVVDLTGQNPTFTYSAAGDYSVSLRVVGEHGGSATLVKTNFVSVLGSNIVDLAVLEAQIESAGPFRNLVVSYGVTNTGSISLSGAWQWADNFYLSTNQVLDSKANRLVSIDESQVLPAGAVYRRTNLVMLPEVNLGKYHLFLKADGSDRIKEINEQNNTLDVRVERGLPDLAPGVLNWTGQAIAGQFIDVSYTVTNRGTLDIRGLAGTDVEFFDACYLSTNATWDAKATLIGGATFSGTLPAGAGYAQSARAYLPPMPAGNYYLLLRADSGGFIVESDPANNTLAVPISLAAPDLAPIALVVPRTAPSDARIEVVCVVTNVGSAAAMGFWADTLFLSTNSVWDDKDYSLGYSFAEGPVPLGGSYATTNSVRFPGWSAGTYYLLAKVDSWGVLSEVGKGNNVLAVPITLLTAVGLPDLQPVSLTAPNSALPGAAIEVVYAVTNSGGTAVTGEWFDIVWFSTNAVWDETATMAGMQSVTGPVPKQGGYVRTNTVTVPKVPGGSYYLMVQANAFGLVEEAPSTNNTLATAITVQPPSLLPDLAVLSLAAPDVARPGQAIQVTYAITNQGANTASAPWIDLLTLSTDPIGEDPRASFLGFFMSERALTGGESRTHVRTVVLPKVAEGPYYLVLRVDAMQTVNESTKENNTLVQPIVLGTRVVRFREVQMLSDGNFRLGIEAVIGANYQLQVSSDLARWENVFGWTCTNSPAYLLVPSIRTPGQRFYRLSAP